MRIGLRVLQILKEKGLSQKGLAEYLNVGTSTISGWNANNRNPTSEFIIPICEYLGVSPTYLLTGESDSPHGISEDDADLLRRYHSLDKEGQHMVQAALIQESRRIQQLNSLDVAINPALPPPSPGRDEAVVHAGASPPKKVKPSSPKTKNAL